MTFDSDTKMPSKLCELNESLESILELGEISTVSFAALFEEGNLSEILLSRAGGYDGQTLKTIVRTKLWDLKQGLTRAEFGLPLEQGVLSEEQIARPLCFWAFNNGKNIGEMLRDKSESEGSQLDSDSLAPLVGRRSYFVVLPLTTDLSKAGDFNPELNPVPFNRDGKHAALSGRFIPNMDKFRTDITVDPDLTVKSFCFGTHTPLPYPSTLFPEIAETATSALVVSGLWLTEEWMKKFTCSPLRGFLDSKTRTKPATNYMRTPCAFVVSDQSKDGRSKVYAGIVPANEANPNSDQRWLMARIEYPYVVEISNKSVDL